MGWDVPFNGKVQTFPDDATPDEIAQVLGTTPDKLKITKSKEPMTVGGLVKNYGKQVLDLAKGPFYKDENVTLGTGIRMYSPLDALSGLSSLGRGTLEALAHGSNYPQDKQSIHEQKARAVGRTIKEGTQQLVEDPIRFAYEHPLDVSLALSGGLGALKSGAEAAGLAKTAKALETTRTVVNPARVATKKLGFTATPPAPEEIQWERRAAKKFRNAFAPSTTKFASPDAQARLDDSISKVVKMTVDDADNLKYIEPFSQEIGKIDIKNMNVGQLSQALPQLKHSLFTAYNDMMLKANRAGLTIDGPAIAKKLRATFGGEYAETWRKKIADFAEEQAQRLETYKNGKMSLNDAQRLIKDINDDMGDLLKSGEMGATGTKKVLGDIAREMRDQLDSQIERVAEEGGPGYKMVRDHYKAVKDVESYVHKKAAQVANKEGAFDADLFDVWSLGVATGGIISGNPATLAKAFTGWTASKLRKEMRDPDHIVKNLFRKASDQIKHKEWLELNGPPTMAASHSSPTTTLTVKNGRR